MQEVRQILRNDIEVLSLNDIGCHEDIPETGETLEANALQKARYVYDHYHVDCFADDTGLEVEALNGAPGVYSARYASMESNAVSHDSEANMARLLRELSGNDNRKARFRTVIALIQKKDVCPCGCTSIKQEHLFEGIVNGEIVQERSGAEGFGYDPIFRPDGFDKTFADMTAEQKNQISHRGRAAQKLAEHLGKVIAFLSLFLLSFLPLHAQIGTWHSYTSHAQPQQIVKVSSNILFVRASNGLYSYDLTDHSITTYDKANVLSDTYITYIGWNQQTKRLIIAYKNSNIDLMDLNGNVINISSLYTKTMTVDKTINFIYNYQQYAYLCTGFGLMKMNIERAEISETYMLNKDIDAMTIKDGQIYVRVKHLGTVLTAPINTNLIDKSNWVTTDNYPDFNTDTSDWDTYYQTVTSLRPDGPKHNNFCFIKFENNRLYTCGGKEDFAVPAFVQVYDNNSWHIYQEDLKKQTGIEYYINYCLDYDPADTAHVFVGNASGLYEFRNGQFLKLYNNENSPIETFDGRDTNFELITGLKFNSDGTLWFFNSQAPTQSLISMDKSGTFTSHSLPQLMKLNQSGFSNKSLGFLTDIRFDNDGHMWFVNNNWFIPSIYRYNLQTKELKSFTNFINQDGASIENVINVTCSVEDMNGDVWVGTNRGPLIIERSQIEASDPYFTQFKVPRNDGTNNADYLLYGLPVLSIAIDGGNRKWIGSNGNGVYLISADNTEQIHHFTKENSNLLSNKVVSIAINHTTGEVFFATDEGLCSYMSDATEPHENIHEDNVYAYPNPVEPGYTGLITVVGLSSDADVMILTSNGKLVAHGRSNGGTFTWDGRDMQGRRVASGIYMVATATNTGEKGVVTKIAIVN